MAELKDQPETTPNVQMEKSERRMKEDELRMVSAFERERLDGKSLVPAGKRKMRHCGDSMDTSCRRVAWGIRNGTKTHRLTN